VLSQLDFTDKLSFEDAGRGFLMKPANSTINNAVVPGIVAWDNARFDYQNSTCPPTVNPSLWRQAQLNDNWGLF
jgi:alkyl sulfatase BDS1-like metallo-beta-lactamase superfamily hydrolase